MPGTWEQRTKGIRPVQRKGQGTWGGWLKMGGGTEGRADAVTGN
jgi:hypothetical protein